MNDEPEIWKQIPGWPYEASDLGRIRHMQTGAVFPQDGKSRYHCVTLHRDDGESWREPVHCLVLLAFRGEPPLGHVGAHLDDVSRNNRLSNLQWSTQSENIKTAYRLSPERWTGPPKIPAGKRNVSRSVVLLPELWPVVMKRVAALDLSFSKYVQKIIRYDLSQRNQP